MWLPKLRKNMNIVGTGVNIKQFDETTFTAHETPGFSYKIAYNNNEDRSLVVTGKEFQAKVKQSVL